MPQRFSPGDEVPRSGIYKVVHNPGHTEDHEVTCVGGKKFPPCRKCRHPTFELVHAARYVKGHRYFRGE
jgi:hypothetical protein